MAGPVEKLKAESRHLRGTLAEEIASSSPSFSKPATTVLKFHGIYQQDDRDKRKIGGEKIHTAMIRIGIPGGVLTPNQYLELDRLAGEVGDGTLRITSRQDIQYHYVGKQNLKRLIQALHSIELSSLAACGDVVRNITACAAPLRGRARQDLRPYVLQLARELKPKTNAYWEIWLDGEKAVSLEEESEPLYGDTYLPRKFKIGFTYPKDNTTDVYSNDIGIVPHFDSQDRLEGFTILAGGGMGQSNGVKASHPRMADPVAFVEPHQLLDTCKAIVSIHRDFGNRENRKLARLKYVLEAWGLEKFRAEMESRLGRSLASPRAVEWLRSDDYLGWHEQDPAPGGEPLWFLGIRVISGRVADTAAQRLRSGIRAVVERYRPEVRLTAQQNLLLAGIRAADRAGMEALLNAHGVRQASSLPPVLRHSMACPALPTCGQALAEAERALPLLAEEIQAELNRVGLGTQEIQVRMTGCPNGCARPYTAEIGIVGQSVDLYSLYLGGSPFNTRLARLYRHGIPVRAVAAALRPFFEAYAAGRQPGERFGDYIERVGLRVLEPAAEEVA